MGRLLLVRHADAGCSASGYAQGWLDVGLTDFGRRQAGRLAARVAPFQIGAVLTSDLMRAVETAEILIRGGETPRRVDSRLREQHYGDWEGRSYEEVQAGTPELYARLMSGDLRFAPPGGESIADLLNRVRRVEALLRPVAEDHAADTMVVAHAGSIRALAVTLLKLPRSTFWRLKVSPASLSVISLYADGATVDLWNDTCHLEAAGER